MNLGSYLGAFAAIALIFLGIALPREDSGSVSQPFSTSTTTNLGESSQVPSLEIPENISSPTHEVPPVPEEEPQTPAPHFDGDVDVAASRLESALVNIICTVPLDSGIRSISGTGVIIDPKGIILTNAHVAQYFLLTHHGVSCQIRTGSPAQNAYQAAPIFVSPAWIQANRDILSEDQPTGTGEYDFAFLAITGSSTSSPLPHSFPSVPLSHAPPVVLQTVVIESYGAQLLNINEIESALYPTIVLGSVKKLFTYATTSIDVIALGGSAAAQEGSSGGGVVDPFGNLIGTIATSIITGDFAARNVNAITASYIRAEYANEMGRKLDALLGQQTSISVANFATYVPGLEMFLTQDLH